MNLLPADGRSRVRPRLRPNLEILPLLDAGEHRFVLRDPVSLRFFHLSEQQKAVVDLFDGQRNLDEIRIAFETAHRPQRLSDDTLDSFVAQLLRQGLLRTDSEEAGTAVRREAESRIRRERRAKFLNPLSIKIPLGSPNAVLERALPLYRWLFGPVGMALATVLCIAAAVVGIVDWTTLTQSLREHEAFFTPRTLLMLWVVIGVIKLAHELGHAACCKAMGGDVHEIGILFLFFFPTLYCDVNDAWRFPKRSRRLAVSAAGMYVEFMIAAIATIAWHFADSGSMMRLLSGRVVVVCTVATLAFNLNPLMRFDGYYLLSDWLEVPNLMATSQKHLRDQLLHWLGAPKVDDPAWTPLQRAVIDVYSVAVFAYRFFMVAIGFRTLALMLAPYRLASLWIPLAVLTGFSMLVKPAFDLIQEVVKRRLASAWRRTGIAWAVVAFAGACYALLCLPLPAFVDSVAMIQVDPNYVERMTVGDAGGFVEKIAVVEGQRVKQGDILFVLENPKLELAVRLNEADQAHRTLQRRTASAVLLGEKKDSITDDLRQIDLALASLQSEHQALLQVRRQLTIRAPRSGVVLSVLAQDQKGRWLEKGAELCRVGDPSRLRAVVVVPASDQNRLATGQRATVLVHGLAGSTWQGTVDDISRVDAPSVPEQLTASAGGDIAVKPDPTTREHRPFSPHYMIAIRFDDHRFDVQSGMMGHASIHVESLTPWQRLRRFATLQFDLFW